MDYYLVNVVRKARTRQIRKAAPAPQRFAQHYCGGKYRLVRGRHVKITEGDLKAHWEELEAKQAAGALEVHLGTPMGSVFAFDTLKRAPQEVDDAPQQSESPDDAPEDAPSPEAEEEPAEAGGEDFSKMKKGELIEIIEANSDWARDDLEKLKKSELLELIG